MKKLKMWYEACNTCNEKYKCLTNGEPLCIWEDIAGGASKEEIIKMQFKLGLPKYKYSTKFRSIFK